MSYKILALKWRPQTFLDVVGQEYILTTLTNSLSLNRIHHAYLFSGARGVGKTTIARLLAKGLNCEKCITATPCRRCSNCLQMEEGCFVDLIEIDAASRTKVEDTRDLLDTVQYAPAIGRFKVYLIDEVHMLSRHSFNALLKTLEEPPAHVKFLLATTDPKKLPLTILSRCLQFHLNILENKQIYNQIKKILQIENIVFDAHSLQLLSNAANGSMRDALMLTDQAISLGNGNVSAIVVSQILGVCNDNQPLIILESLVNANADNAMAQIEKCAIQGIDWENLLIEILTLLHRLLMFQLLPEIQDQEQSFINQRLKSLAKILPPEEAQLYYQIFLLGRKELTYAPNRRIGVEMTILRVLAFYPKELVSKEKICSKK